MRRVLTALVLIPLIAALVLWANWWLFDAVLVLVACLCYCEYDQLASAYGFGAPGPLGYAAGLLVLFTGRNLWPWLLLVLLALVALAVAMRASDLAHSLPRAALLVMGVIYVFGCWKCALLIRERGAHWLLYALLINWAGDIGAYYAGRRFGRRRLAERVSPGKTWAGTAGSLIASVIVAGAYLLRFVSDVTVIAAIVLTVAANIAGQLGDLCESAIKRGAGRKDSGRIVPGHGGILDRVDSTLFVLPVIYAYLQLASPLQ